MPDNAFESRRAERAQRVATARSTVARDGAQEQVTATRAELVGAAGQYDVRRLELDRREETRTRFLEENVTAAEGGVQRMVRAILWSVVKSVSVLTLDVLLLAAVAEFAISLAYILPDGELPPLWALLLLPLTLQGLETFVGMQMVALPQQVRGTVSWPVWGWRGVGVMLAFVMPAMSWYALQLSLQAREEVLDATTTVLGTGILVLAFVCHLVMITSAQATLDGFAHIGGRLRLRTVDWGIGRAQRRMQAARSRTWTALPPYSAALDEYRRLHGAPPSSLLLARHEAELVNEALGESVVLPPDDDDPRPSQAPPPPSPQSGSDGAEATPTPAAEGRAEDSEDAQGEAEYLRRILDARLRDTDGEFHV